MTTPLPRVKAAGRLREHATHEAVLKSAAVAHEEMEAEPEVAAESLKDFAKPRLRRPHLEGVEVSEKALECIAVCTGAQPRALWAPQTCV